MSRRKLIEEAAHHVTREFLDRGRLIEAGFAAFAHLVIAKDAPPSQLREMRLAFMAGAEHLFSSIMSQLDEDAEPTEADLRRMDLISKELDEWRATLSERIQPAQGRA